MHDHHPVAWAEATNATLAIALRDAAASDHVFCVDCRGALFLESARRLDSAALAADIVHRYADGETVASGVVSAISCRTEVTDHDAQVMRLAVRATLDTLAAAFP